MEIPIARQRGESRAHAPDRCASRRDGRSAPRGHDIYSRYIDNKKSPH